MNIKDFLIDNYIWIIVIILITIITIIGFLADKSRGKNNEKKIKNNKNTSIPTQDMNNQQLDNNVSPMQYQPQSNDSIQNQTNNKTDNGIDLNNNSQNNQSPQINQNMQNNQEVGNINNIGQTQQPVLESIAPAPENNFVNNLQPVENALQNMPQEEYQPLSEQKPNIPPQPVPNFSNIQNNQEMVNPMNTGFNQNINTTIPTAVATPQMQQPVNQISQPSMMMQNQMNNNLMNNNQMNNGMNFNNNGGSMNNFNQNNMTIPSPIPTPRPVNPQPIMQNSYPQSQPVGNAYGNGMSQQPNQNMNGQMAQNGQSSPTPVNFVFGPQNNNQNM